MQYTLILDLRSPIVNRISKERQMISDIRFEKFDLRSEIHIDLKSSIYNRKSYIKGK